MLSSHAVSHDHRTFPGPPHVPHTLSIDFAPKPQTDGDATAEDIVIAGIEVGGCLVSASDGLWEPRHGDIIPDTQRPQLCIDVHQVRPDPFNPRRCHTLLLHEQTFCHPILHQAKTL